VLAPEIGGIGRNAGDAIGSAWEQDNSHLKHDQSCGKPGRREGARDFSEVIVPQFERLGGTACVGYRRYGARTC